MIEQIGQRLSTWVMKVFWSVSDQAAMAQIVDNLRQITPNLFAGDDLITFGKNLSFASDNKFLAAFNALNPSRVEKAIVWRKYVLYWAARRGLELEGDFVEAGCYTGMSVRLLCDLLDFATQDRRYWLYDAFTHWERDDGYTGVSEHSADLERQVRDRFSDTPNVEIVAGLIPDSFRQGTPDKIAFMHIDLNSVEAERATLETLYDRLVPGALVVFDDYGFAASWNQKVSADAFVARHGKMILELPTGQGLLIK